MYDSFCCTDSLTHPLTLFILTCVPSCTCTHVLYAQANRLQELEDANIEALNKTLVDQGAKFRSDIIRSSDGTNLHVVHNTARVKPTANRPLVVFLHGYPQIWSTWSRQMTVAANLGYPVAALELRGTCSFAAHSLSRPMRVFSFFSLSFHSC